MKNLALVALLAAGASVAAAAPAGAAEFCVKNRAGYVAQTLVKTSKDGNYANSWMNTALGDTTCATYSNGTKITIYTNATAGKKKFCNKEFTLERDQSLTLKGTTLAPKCDLG